MDTNKFKIIKLDRNYIQFIEVIWKESLPRNLKSMIGNSIINSYLEKFFKNESNIAIGVLNSEQLIGFVLFGKDSEIVRNIVKEDFLKIISSFLKSLFLLKFNKILNFFNCIIYILLSKKKESLLSENNTELNIICIDKKNQNKGLGSYLIKQSLEKYYSFFQKFDYVYVKTLKKEIYNIKFYEKNNFKFLYEIFGRIYLKYKI
tara:strand:- start:1824 stop:2435 length:612 start_codon:yes stop_codon:yes gene_type:complete